MSRYYIGVGWAQSVRIVLEEARISVSVVRKEGPVGVAGLRRGSYIATTLVIILVPQTNRHPG